MQDLPFHWQNDVMTSLDDMLYFEAVVRHGGFAAASRALRIPKSKLSRRVAGLERRLDVRLLERSARRLDMTAVGAAFYAHCRAAMNEVEAAEEVAQALNAEPRGLVRVGCPPGFGEETLAGVMPAFFAAFPKVRMQLLVSLEQVDLLAERVDVVIRANPGLDQSRDLIARRLGPVGIVLVASPEFLAAHPPIAAPADLAAVPTITYAKTADHDVWELYDRDGVPTRVRHEPRIICNEFAVLREAAVEGLGVAILPEALCHEALASGRLRRVLPAFHAGDTTMHILFTSRRGMLPAVKVLVDHLIATLPEAMRLKRQALRSHLPEA
ncbi:LysR substrate-binding domain-containing protein [Aurantimonas sp. HBX-1]|uniref:LysR substrate-binding domain-containing protein n=1 Tax=Aurantimonas sp. HBX-1 TaxID=2906072 RepID=UPI001F3B0189|nr:LysR substrate-binding domain-containing protein [Aurantimonas sp. HBX-1]UIJ73911.1 LysR substrate-binding domain-containing protein [Aurantimonas sp. HBX-1]